MTNNGANNPDDEENDENDQNENGKLENELIDRNFNEGSSVLPNLPKFAKKCENFGIFLLLRFYVKSILANFEAEN